METLLDMAKRIGIKPNPNLTDEEYAKIKERMLKELGKIKPTLVTDLDRIIYDLRKNTPTGIAQQFNESILQENIENFTRNFVPGISSYAQYSGNFWYHSAVEDDFAASERFIADIKLDDSGISGVFEKLDRFVLKHKSGYKITTDGNRTDTLNVYMHKPITPQVACGFYEIVKPVLQTKNHEYLDGYPIKQNGQEIQGIKFGPEPMSSVSHSGDFQKMKERLKLVFPCEMMAEICRGYCGQKSLGEVAAKAQLCDFLYYLIGKEGQNPIQLGNQLGDPHKHYTKKSIDIDLRNNSIFRELMQLKYLHCKVLFD